jgi:DNA-binding NarL/FixJ family response regulator
MKKSVGIINSTMIRIAIADDEALFRKGLRLLLEDYEGIEVMLEASDGQDLLEKLVIAQPFPNVLLLDLKMPKIDGIEVSKRLRDKYPALKIVILSTHYSKAFILNLIEIGASAYLPKNTEPNEVVHTIRMVHDKGFHYNDKVMGVIRENFLEKSKPKASFDEQVSRRELEILQLICEQYTTTEIAAKLYISPRTVDGHRNNIMQKLGVKNTAGLVAYAIQNQLIKISPTKFW